jgi:hypothetical protein
VRFVSAVYDAEKRSAVPAESVAKALGSENLTGAARAKIGAMRHFGLLEGRGRMRVSDTALAIVLRPSPEKFADALNTAAWNPDLYKELRDEYGDASDETLRFHLLRDRGFSADGANRAMRTYRETVDFLASNVGLLDHSEQLQPVDKVDNTSVGSASLGAAMSVVQQAHPSTMPPLSFPLGEKIATVTFLGGRPTMADIDDLVTYLERWKLRLPSQEPPNEPEASTDGDKVD